MSDIETILSHRYDNGADYWSTEDGRIYKGNPFSTISSLGMLHELGADRSHEAVKGGLELILNACREDGRIRVAPKAPMYPCYTAEAGRVLCRFGLTDHDNVRRTVNYLLANTHDSGGWRCNFTRFGKGPETQTANPGATLYVLDMFRFYPDLSEGNEEVDKAVVFLLDHWDTRKPLGPCHWGIGNSFMKVEYPFIRYNIFLYTYVLSFYKKAVNDNRFKEAYDKLKSKLDEKGEIIVENPHRRLGKMSFCKRGEPSEYATKRYREIVNNLD